MLVTQASLSPDTFHTRQARPDYPTNFTAARKVL